MSTASVASTSQASPTPTREIVIKLKGVDAVPEPIPAMNVGDTIRYVSNDGEVTIVFPRLSPFRLDNEVNTIVSGGVIMTLVRESTDLNLPNDAFPCSCSLKLKSGDTVGWEKGTSISGGEHHVRRP